MHPAAIYNDFSGLTELKARAGKDSDAALDQVARQFESLFIHQMLKSMRQANLAEGLLDSDQSLFYRDMFDQQLSVHLAENGGIGLAAEIKRQLGGGSEQNTPAIDLAAYRNRPVATAPPSSRASEPSAAAAPVAGSAAAARVADPAEWQPGDFVRNLWPWAIGAANQLGLAPQALLAQAALETGWGKRLMRLADGSPANNLFGIKADQRWQGHRVGVDTLEYEQGAAVKKRAFFRAYDSFADSFNDYVLFIRANPRYQEALKATDDPGRYFSALQQAGYATDPDYARKIDGVLSGREMRQALQQLKTAQGRPL